VILVSEKNPAPISLAATLKSGQVFHWDPLPDGSWIGLIGDHLARVSEINKQIVIEQGDPEILHRYFSLDHPLEQIYAAFPKDPLSQEALTLCHDLRILRQPRWECLATFITSSMKQVAHIRSMSVAIRNRIGTPVSGSPHPAYPSFESLAHSDEKTLLECGLGYRAANLLKTARLLTEGAIDLEALQKRSTTELRGALMTLPGVGVKVANCVLLFAYERLDAVPIDVWIQRILIAMRNGREGTPTQLAKYARRRLGPYAGYVQQYLFHQARTDKKNSRASVKSPA
jgi:N-glycosylase/DNA lyase